MPVYKRNFRTGDKWCVYVIFPNGRRYRRVIGTKKHADQIQKKLESEIVEGKWQLREREDVPFSALVLEYLDYAEASKAKSTYRCDRCRIEGHLLRYLGDTPLTQITPQMVDTYKGIRVKEGAAAKSINHELSNLSHMLKKSVEWRYIDRNVVCSVEKLKVVRNPARYLSQDEIRKLLTAARGFYIYPLLVTAIHTGMRKSELFNLKWDDVDFQQRTVTVQSKSDWHTKNYKARTIQMTPFLYEVLKEHKERQTSWSDYIFTYKGQRIRDNIKKSLRTVVTRAGLEHMTLHSLRHTFASQLVMSGVSLRDVQELMGHQNFETTLRYAHLSPGHVKKQVLNLPFASG